MQLNTRFNVGDEVWFLNNSEVAHEKITRLQVIVGFNLNPPEKVPSIAVLYFCGNKTTSESSAFATKEDLINSL